MWCFKSFPICLIIPSYPKTWEILKDSIGKDKCNNQNFPERVIVDYIATTDETQIAENLISVLTEINPKHAKEIETHTIKFDGCLEQCDTIQPDNSVTLNELRDIFFPFRWIKVPVMMV